MTQPDSDEQLARRALDGSREAVEQLVRRLQPVVYGLAVRMLWHAEDAEDATQEILIRVVTRLSQFDTGRRLRTWVHRVATNYLLDMRRRPMERMTFEGFADDLLAGLSSQGPSDAERSVVIEEVRVGCTLALLQCLDRGHRLAYILGEALGLSAAEACEALELTPAAYRKRLQRARAQVESFTRAHCGLVSDDAACRCPRRVPAGIQLGRVRPEAPQFAGEPASFQEVRALIRQVETARRVVELHRQTRLKQAASDLAGRVLAALEPREAHRGRTPNELTKT